MRRWIETRMVKKYKSKRSRIPIWIRSMHTADIRTNPDPGQRPKMDLSFCRCRLSHQVWWKSTLLLSYVICHRCHICTTYARQYRQMPRSVKNTGKGILDLHPESDQCQNLITSRGSSLAHAPKFGYLADRRTQTHTHTADHNTCSASILRREVITVLIILFFNSLSIRRFSNQYRSSLIEHLFRWCYFHTNILFTIPIRPICYFSEWILCNTYSLRVDSTQREHNSDNASSLNQKWSGIPDWSGCGCPTGRSQNVLDLFPCRRPSVTSPSFVKSGLWVHEKC